MYISGPIFHLCYLAGVFQLPLCCFLYKTSQTIQTAVNIVSSPLAICLMFPVYSADTTEMHLLFYFLNRRWFKLLCSDSNYTFILQHEVKAEKCFVLHFSATCQVETLYMQTY